MVALHPMHCGHFKSGECECLSSHTHTHTHTHIYIYIEVWLLAQKMELADWVWFSNEVAWCSYPNRKVWIHFSLNSIPSSGILTECLITEMSQWLIQKTERAHEKQQKTVTFIFILDREANNNNNNIWHEFIWELANVVVMPLRKA